MENWQFGILWTAWRVLPDTGIAGETVHATGPEVGLEEGPLEHFAFDWREEALAFPNNLAGLAAQEGTGKNSFYRNSAKRWLECGAAAAHSNAVYCVCDWRPNHIT